MDTIALLLLLLSMIAGNSAHGVPIQEAARSCIVEVEQALYEGREAEDWKLKNLVPTRVKTD